MPQPPLSEGRNKQDKNKIPPHHSHIGTQKTAQSFFEYLLCACGTRALYLIDRLILSSEVHPQPCLFVFWESGFALYRVQTSLNLLFNSSLPWIFLCLGTPTTLKCKELFFFSNAKNLKKTQQLHFRELEWGFSAYDHWLLFQRKIIRASILKFLLAFVCFFVLYVEMGSLCIALVGLELKVILLHLPPKY